MHFVIRGTMKDGSKVFLGSDREEKRAQDRAHRLDEKIKKNADTSAMELPVEVAVEQVGEER